MLGYEDPLSWSSVEINTMWETLIKKDKLHQDFSSIWGKQIKNQEK